MDLDFSKILKSATDLAQGVIDMGEQMEKQMKSTMSKEDAEKFANDLNSSQVKKQAENMIREIKDLSKMPNI